MRRFYSAIVACGLALALSACGGLSAEAIQARDALSEALSSRDPDRVSATARAAAAWQGQDAELDRLLGDALANVLMRPEEGLPLLEAHPAPEDPSWKLAFRAAALRSGDRAAMERAWRASGKQPPPLEVPMLNQVVSRALHDPGFDIEGVDLLLTRCQLLMRRPTVGRKSLGMQVEGDLTEAARALGARGLVMARSVLQTDLASNAQVWRCGDMVLLDGDKLPSPLPPRVTVLGANDGKEDVFLELREEEGVPVVFVASNAEWGARWVRAASLMAASPDAEQGKARVREQLGSGLAGSAFPATPAAP